MVLPVGYISKMDQSIPKSQLYKRNWFGSTLSYLLLLSPLVFVAIILLLVVSTSISVLYRDGFYPLFAAAGLEVASFTVAFVVLRLNYWIDLAFSGTTRYMHPSINHFQSLENSVKTGSHFVKNPLLIKNKAVSSSCFNRNHSVTCQGSRNYVCCYRCLGSKSNAETEKDGTGIAESGVLPSCLGNIYLDPQSIPSPSDKLNIGATRDTPIKIRRIDDTSLQKIGMQHSPSPYVIPRHISAYSFHRHKPPFELSPRVNSDFLSPEFKPLTSHHSEIKYPNEANQQQYANISRRNTANRTFSSEDVNLEDLRHAGSKSLMRTGLDILANLSKKMVAVLASPSALISSFFRTLAWCFVWLWATTLIERPEGERSILAWQFKSPVPSAYLFIEAMFLWTVTFDFCVGAWMSSRKLRYFLHLYTVVDLATLPITGLFLNLIFRENQVSDARWLILLGYIRFLRLVKSEKIFLKAQLNLSPVKTRIWSIAITVFAIVFTYAGIMFILESPVTLGKPAPVRLVFDYVYFAVAIISTVSFGDYAPTTRAGRGVTIFFILLTFSYVVGEVRKMTEALRTPSTMIGSLPQFGQDFICFVGPVQPSQLALICREMILAFPDSVRSVVLVTPLPVERYSNVVVAALQKGNMRVFVRGSEHSSLYPSTLEHFLGNCRAAFVCCNTRPCDEEKSLSQGIDIIEQEEDQLTLVRFLGARNSSLSHGDISIQLIHAYRKDLVTQMGAKIVLCLNEVKMKLIGKSCIGCPGFVTLVGNWFYTPTERQEAHTYGGNADMEAYSRGARYQVYRMDFAECFQGLKYNWLMQLLFKHFGVYLIGIISSDSNALLNPVSYTVGEELKSSSNIRFAGIVLAPSLKIVLKISHLSKSAYMGKTNFLLEATENGPFMLDAIATETHAKSKDFRALISKEIPAENSFLHPPTNSVNTSTIQNPSSLVRQCRWNKSF